MSKSGVRFVARILASGVALAGCWLDPSRARESSERREPIVGQPCEGCEWTFEGMPAAIESVARIASPDEPGEPMRIDGLVRDAAGRPRAGVVIYAYHTDSAGTYPRGVVRHGRLRSWAKTDENGSFAFDTVRPGGYPGTDIPSHVHLHVIEPGRCAYYIDDIELTDDPRLAPSLARHPRAGRGGPGVATPTRVGNGWRVEREIVLGRNVPGYADCDDEEATP